MRPGPKPLPQPSPLWSTFRPETHRHLVLLWTDLLQRQLPAARGRAHVPGEPCHERHLAQGFIRQASVTDGAPMPTDASGRCMADAARPTTGPIIPNNGHHTFHVENGTTYDAYAALGVPARIVASFYIRSGEILIYRHISDGNFRIRFFTGDGWSTSCGRFVPIN